MPIKPKIKKIKVVPALPLATPRLLLPAPHPHTAVLLVIAVLPIVLVVLFAAYPWFTLSNAVTRTLILETSFVYLVGLIALAVYIVKLFYDLLMKKTGDIEHDKHIIGLLILFAFCILVFTSILYFIEPAWNAL